MSKKTFSEVITEMSFRFESTCTTPSEIRSALEIVAFIYDMEVEMVEMSLASEMDSFFKDQM
jgi:hypothetical protein